MASGNELVVQVSEQPIILQFTKQGIEGPTGPVGEKGDAGITWELELTMTGSPDGTCKMKLYKNGELASDEIHYVNVFYLAYGAVDFAASSWSRNISGEYEFEYTNVRAVKVIVYEDSSKEVILCANTCNFGKSATITIGDVTNVEQGSEYVTNVGNQFDAEFNFGLPRGRAATIEVGTTTTLPAGSQATVTQRGTTADRIFDFGIPNGGGSGAHVEQTNLILDAGAIYTPSVDEDGVMTWTNNASLTNPDAVQVTVDPAGTWDASKSYQRLDIVTHQGYSYIADRNVPAGISITNTTYWQMIAERGTNGTIMYATFNINLSTGQLEMYTDELYDGANFAINNEGILQVII